MNNPELHIKLSGDASGVLKAVQETKNALNQLSQNAKQTSAATVAQGVALGQMFADMGKKALSMAKDSMNAFTTVASETRKLKRVLGGTAEDMSRLRFVGYELGVSVDTIARAMGIASKHFVENDKAVQQLGVSYKDADGKVKPAIKLIGEIGDRLNALQDPYAKAKAAKDIFGRGYAEMLPVLGLGSEGIKKFAEESDKLGHTMGQKDLDAARAFRLQMKELHATFEGIFIAVGRNVIPALTNLVSTFADLVQGVIRAWKENDTFGRFLRAVAVVLGVVAAAAVAYKTYVLVATAATKAWGIAVKITNAAMQTNPIVLIITAILALIAVIILLVKNFEPVGDAIIAVSGILGNVLGKVIGGITHVFRIAADTVLQTVDYMLMGIGWLAQGLSWLTFGAVDATGSIDKWRSAIQSAKDVLNRSLSDFGDAAWTQGEEYGKKLGKGLVDAIKKLKVPDLGSIFKGKGGAAGAPDGSDYSSTLLPTDEEMKGGGAGKQADRIKEFFKNLVDNARTALEAAKQAAIDAKKQMDDLARSVGDSLRQAFSITDIAESIGGAYGGPNRLLATYRKRLADMREFVGNVKRLKELGLPPEMLQDIVTAGVAKGAALARMLVANPAAITELGSLQEMMRAETAAAGAFVGEAIMGERVAGLTTAAIGSQTQFNQYLGYARQGGYVPTQQDIAASQENIYNSVYMDVSTDADPAAIQRAIDWALATGATARISRGGGGGGRRSAGGYSPGMPGYLGSAGAFTGGTLAPGLQGPVGLPSSAASSAGLQGSVGLPDATANSAGLQGPNTATPSPTVPSPYTSNGPVGSGGPA